MLDHLRRILIVLAIFAGAAFLFQHWRNENSGYGLLSLIKGTPPGEVEKYTAPSNAKLLDSDVPILARMSEESAKLTAAVLPA